MLKSKYVFFRKQYVTKNPCSCTEWGIREDPKAAHIRLGTVCESMGSFLRAGLACGMESLMSTLSHATVTPEDDYYHYDSPTDRELIFGLKLLDESAFTEIVRRYTGRVTRLAERFITNKYEDAEEIANTAFWRLWDASIKGNLNKLNTSKQLWALLGTITVRRVYEVKFKEDYPTRSGKHKRRNFDIIQCITPDCPRFPPVFDPDEYGEFIDYIRDTLNKISNKRIGDIFVLRIQGCTMKEISEQTGFKKSTVFSRLRSAMRWLNENANSLPVATLEPAY